MDTRYGKATRQFLDRAVFPNLGAGSRKTVEGPAVGLDSAIIRVDGKKVLLLTSDPMSYVPGLGADDSAWLSVHLIASDFTTSGIRPTFAAFVYDFPATMDDDVRERYLKVVGDECASLGVSIVSGHTGTYSDDGSTVIGGGTMFGFGNSGGYVTPKMARAGDDVLITKGAAIETTAYLSRSFPRYLEETVGTKLTRQAQKLTRKCSTVSDALVAGSVGLRSHVTSMHDATEGGVLGGLAEMAFASGKAFHVDISQIPVTEEAAAVCRAFLIDPLTSLSEGTLLITCGKGSTAKVLAKLTKSGIPARRIGTVKAGKGLWSLTSGEGPRKFNSSEDGYWRAYRNAVASRLS